MPWLKVGLVGMNTRGPGLERLRLRTVLRRVRGDADLTQQKVAEELGWSLSKIIRIENGAVGVSQTDLRAMLALYGVKDGELISSLIASARVARYQQWSAYQDIYDKSFLSYLEYEASASGMLDYEPMVVPGILQTEEYARTLLSRIGKCSGNILERMITLRMSRQWVLENGSGFKGSFLLDEAVIRRQVGGSRVQKAQIDHLLNLAEHAAIEVRVIPFSEDVHPGYGFPFVVLEFEEGYDDLLFLEHPQAFLVTRDEPELVSSYKETYYSVFSGAVDIRRFVPPGGDASA
jgi:transcriptional regulator with XRE-family HTH domain